MIRQLLAGAMLVITTAGVTLTASQDARPATAPAASEPPPAPSFDDFLPPMLKPGEHHAQLQRLVGNWDTTWKIWQNANVAEQIHTGSTTTKALMNGRYFESESSMDVMGMTMDMKNLVGYDNFREEYFMMHISPMGTGWTVVNGKPSGDGETTYEGTQDRPEMNIKDVPFRLTTKIIDDDHNITTIYYKHEMFGSDDWFKSLEIHNHRAK